MPVTGKNNNFEAAAAHLQPRCPVACKKQSKKRPASVADVNISGVGAPSIGKTGVHLRWYKFQEYKKLTKEQKQELYEWQQENPDEASASKQGKRPGNKQPTKKGRQQQQEPESGLTRCTVSKLVAAEVKAALDKSTDEAKQEQDVEQYIASLVDAAMSNNGDKKQHAKPAAAASATANPAKDASNKVLRSILKNALNRK